MAGNGTFAVDAPAKINLHLEITGRRDDGYHDLRSIFLAVNLADRLSFTFLPRREQDRLSGLIAGVEDRANTVVRAVELFRRETGMRAGVAVTVEKRIPLGSGLGGGSSDAAAALRLCNRAAGRPLDDETLAAIGVEIGSDVPFFLRGTCAVVEGRGELVSPLPCPQGFAIALFVPEFSVNTAEAYRWYDDLPLAFPTSGFSRKEIAEAFRRTPPDEWNFFNSFSSVLFNRYPLFPTLQKRLREEGALFTGVSGSGSSYFGVFAERRTATDCLPKIEGRFRFAGVVEPLQEMPPVRAG